jgi:hypothetical protein
MQARCIVRGDANGRVADRRAERNVRRRRPLIVFGRVRAILLYGVFI